ncbi:MAG: hypothetical protein FWF24_05635 [Alphaproteobacteria bacterium]|nr:hypothetical protein [Alphaproteobacteria bacterium]
MVTVEKEIAKKLRIVLSIQRSIHQQFPEGNMLYEQRSTSIENAFWRAKKEVTERRKELESQEKANRWKWPEIVAGAFGAPALVGAAFKSLYPEVSGGIVRSTQFVTAVLMTLYTTRDSRKAFFKKSLKKPEIKEAYDHFSSYFVKIKEHARKKVKTLFCKKDNSPNP